MKTEIELRTAVSQEVFEQTGYRLAGAELSRFIAILRDCFAAEGDEGHLADHQENEALRNA